MSLSSYDGRGPGLGGFHALYNDELWNDSQEQICIVYYKLYGEGED